MSNDRVYNVRKWIVWAFCVLGIGVLVMNILLIKQNRNLKTQLAGKPPAWRPPVGDTVPSMSGVDVTGERLRVEWSVDARDTFVFVFSQHCGVCDLAWPVWDELRRSAPTQFHRLVYVNIGPPLQKDYVTKRNLDKAIVFAELDPATRISMNFRTTPEVVQISTSGRVEKAWMGLAEGEELASLKRALNEKF